MRVGNRRELLSQIAALSWPTIVEQALQTVVQFADSAMVGRIGAQASASVGMTASVTWLVNSPLWALGVGVMAVVAQAHGAKDERTVRRTGAQSVIMALALGVAIGALTLAISPFLPGWLGAAQELRVMASMYFAIICLPMVFRAGLILFGSVLRAVHDTKTPMLVNTLVNAINIALNFFLIFETRQVALGSLVLTIPGAGLGIVGAAIATAIAYAIGGLLMFAALLANPLVTPRGAPLRLDREIMRRCARVGLPVALSRVGSCLGHVVFSSQVTRLGTAALAAHSLAITAEQAFYIPGYGMQAAASTLCGNALGARDEKRLVETARLLTLLCAGMMAVTGAILFAIPGVMMSLFTRDPLVIAAGVRVLRIVAVSEPLYGASIILEGVFDGMGDTRTPLIISILSMWGVRILLTSVCVSVFGLGLTAVWCCMVADNVTRCLLLAARFVRGDWRARVGL